MLWTEPKGFSLSLVTRKMCQILCSTVAHCRHKKLVRIWDINRLPLLLGHATATPPTTRGFDLRQRIMARKGYREGRPTSQIYIDKKSDFLYY